MLTLHGENKGKIMCGRCGCDGEELVCDSCSMTEAFLNRSVQLLRRYRTETPAGNQPHMICHQVDALLSEIDKEQWPARSDEECRQDAGGRY